MDSVGLLHATECAMARSSFKLNIWLHGSIQLSCILETVSASFTYEAVHASAPCLCSLVLSLGTTWDLNLSAQATRPHGCTNG